MAYRTRSRESKARGIAFQPHTNRNIQQGINKLTNVIRPTLGPQPRVVAVDHALDDKMPELLDNGGVIAKRITQLPDWREDVGAMYLRDILWRLYNQVGDGTATAAVLFQSVYNEGSRYLASGGNAMRLRAAIEKGLVAVMDQLAEMTIRVSGSDDLAHIAETICYDPPVAKILGEVLEIVGEYGRLEIRKGHNRDVEREYVEGMYWERGLVSREMIADPDQARTELHNTAILISDVLITEPQQLFPPLELALRANIGALVIVADRFSDKSIGFLLANKKPDQFQVFAVRTPGISREDKAAALEDLSILTGGRAFIQAAGDTFDTMRVEDFGYARRVWADQRNFGVIGGKGSPRKLRQHIHTLQAAHSKSDEVVTREALLQRIGKLRGGSATVWVGGVTELQLEARLEAAKRAAAAVRGAMMDGVVPGGGIALLACRPALQNLLNESTDADERAAFRILVEAMAEPLCTIATNAGRDGREILAQIHLAGPGHGLDVRSGLIKNMAEAGIYDSAATQKAAVYAGVAGAALALTIDVLVHRKNEMTLQPIKGPGKRKQI